MSEPWGIGVPVMWSDAVGEAAEATERAINAACGGSYPSPAQHDEMQLDRLRRFVGLVIDARLRRIAERLRVSADGPLVPEAEVYVRTVVAKAIEEELEER